MTNKLCGSRKWMGVKSKGHKLGLCADIFYSLEFATSFWCGIWIYIYLYIYGIYIHKAYEYILICFMISYESRVFLYTYWNMFFFVVCSVFYGEWPILQICGSDSIHLLHVLFLKLKILRKKITMGLFIMKALFTKHSTLALITRFMKSVIYC